MVTKKQQDSLLVGPKGAMWAILIILAVGMIVFAIVQSPREDRVATYDQFEPGHVIETGPAR